MDARIRNCVSASEVAIDFGFGSRSAFDQDTGHSCFPVTKLPVEDIGVNEDAMGPRPTVA